MARWRLALVLALAVCCGMIAVAVEDLGTTGKAEVSVVQRATGVPAGHVPGHALDEIIYSENWESGDFAGWVARDLTSEVSRWHRDDNNAFGGSGMSWWMGDSTIGPNGGYLDAWYMVLDSPPIQLGATPALRFWHRYNVEAPGGEPPGYNGWDGMNVRISTNNGSTWIVVPNAAMTPAYDRTSLYSFGVQHNEGPNIPGWCGANATWHSQTANLTQWANQTVKLRWAFASDPAYSTPDNPAMFGWMVDAIRVYNGASDTVFTHDANDDGGFTTQSNVPVGGNLWRVATDNSSPAGSQVIVCNNANNNQYNPNMNTTFTSPFIDCRTLAPGQLWANFIVTGSLVTAGPCPGPQVDSCDYWGVSVSGDSGLTWCRVSNPTCQPGGQNFVYIDVPAFWDTFSVAYQQPIDLSSYIGDVIQVRFEFTSYVTPDVDYGPKFDGFFVAHQAGLPNDVSLYTLQVRYPTMVNYLTPTRAYFRNVGQNAANFPAFYRVNTGAWTRFGGTIQLGPNQTATRDTLVTFVAPTISTVQARSALSGDQNLNNDTSTVANIVVQPAGAFPEIGYDNRSVVWRFNYQTGEGAVAHFTPLSDGVTGPAYDVREIKAQFDSEQADNRQFRLHVYLGGQPGQGTEVVNQLVTVTPAETGVNTWKVIDLTGVPELQDISQDYWVWFEVTESGTMRFPMVLGDDEKPWADEHFHTYNGTTLSNSAYFYQIHSVINPSPVSVDEIPGALPTVWTLAQNYPNPFNPATEIRFSVPKAERMTLKVYNLMGQEVATLVNEVLQAGVYNATFDASHLPSGVYVYRLASETYTASHKMLLLK